MLILSRRPHERIVISDSIEIEVVRIQGNRVRLAISAPAKVSVRRQELCDLKVAEPCLPE
ncbi:MAG: carbon storage regulator [Planctomycetales bacterium]